MLTFINEKECTLSSFNKNVPRLEKLPFPQKQILSLLSFGFLQRLFSVFTNLIQCPKTWIEDVWTNYPWKHRHTTSLPSPMWQRIQLEHVVVVLIVRIDPRVKVSAQSATPYPTPSATWGGATPRGGALDLGKGVGETVQAEKKLLRLKINWHYSLVVTCHNL